MTPPQKGTSWFCPGCREVLRVPCPCGAPPLLIETASIVRDANGRITDVQMATTRLK